MFFPLSHVFRQHQTLSDRVVELGLRILKVLVETCWRMNISKELAKQLMILVTFIVGGNPAAPPAAQGQRRASEECKIAGCECLSGLFNAMALSGSVRMILTEEQNLPAVGHLVTTLLETLLGSTDIVELGKASLEALTTLLKDCIKDKDVLASFLPGIVSQLSKVLAPQSRMTRRAHTILAGSIGLLAHVVSTVLGDVAINDLPSSSSSSSTDKDMATTEGLRVDRSAKWFTATSGQVKVALEGVIIRNRSHGKVNVRRAICTLCETLLGGCTKALEASEGYGLIVDTLVILSGDEDPTLAPHAGYTLQILAATNPKIRDTLQQSLHGWIVSLPRVMQSQDEAMKAKVVDRISTGFKMLTAVGGGSEVLTDMIAQNIRDSLEATQAFSDAEVGGIEVHSSSGPGELLALKPTTREASSYPELVLGHRTQKETVKSLKRLLETIGTGGTETVQALANTYIRDARDGDPASLWMAINILRASIPPEDEWLNLDLEDSQESALTQELFSVAHGILVDTTSATNYLPGDSSMSTLTTCLALESLSLVASRQKSAFKEELVDTVYPLIHLLGSPSPTIAHHAIITLNHISASCGYASPQVLVLDNIDYLVNAIALKLNTFDISPQAPKVLGMMIKLTGKRILPFLDDLVESVFAALANYHGYEKLCEGLFGVLKDIVTVGAGEEDGISGEVKKIESSAAAAQKEKDGKKRRLTSQGLIERFREQERKRKRKHLEELETAQEEPQEPTPHQPWGKPTTEKKFDPEAYLNGETNIDDEPQDPQTQVSAPPEAPPEEPTPTYKMLQNITRLTQHYLTHPSKSLRLQLLQLIGTSSLLLGKNEKEFLPLVNDVWPVLFERLFDPEAHVVVIAARTIARLAGVCGDFISSRMNDGWARGGGTGAGGVGGPEGGGVYALMRKTRMQVDRERGPVAARRGAGASGKQVMARNSQGGGGHSMYSPAWQVWNALLDMCTEVARGCRLDEVVFDELLEMVAGEIEAGGAGRRELGSALRGVNADAVWLELERRKWERGDVGSGGWVLPVVEGVGFPEVVV